VFLKEFRGPGPKENCSLLEWGVSFFVSFSLSSGVVENLLKHCLTTSQLAIPYERWGAGVETQKNVRGEVGGWGRVTFNEPYVPSLSTIYDGA